MEHQSSDPRGTARTSSAVLWQAVTARVGWCIKIGNITVRSSHEKFLAIKWRRYSAGMRSSSAVVNPRVEVIDSGKEKEGPHPT